MYGSVVVANRNANVKPTSLSRAFTLVHGCPAPSLVYITQPPKLWSRKRIRLLEIPGMVDGGKLVYNWVVGLRPARIHHQIDLGLYGNAISSGRTLSRR